MYFLIRGKLSPHTDFAFGLVGILTLAILWCLATYGGLVKPLFLPPPDAIWQGTVDFYERGWLFRAMWRSLWRVTQALILVSLLGIPIGICMGAFASVDAFLRSSRSRLDISVLSCAHYRPVPACALEQLFFS